MSTSNFTTISLRHWTDCRHVLDNLFRTMSPLLPEYIRSMVGTSFYVDLNLYATECLSDCVNGRSVWVREMVGAGITACSSVCMIPDPSDPSTIWITCFATRSDWVCAAAAGPLPQKVRRTLLYTNRPPGRPVAQLTQSAACGRVQRKAIAIAPQAVHWCPAFVSRSQQSQSPHTSSSNSYNTSLMIEWSPEIRHSMIRQKRYFYIYPLVVCAT